jgi:hypothetical protein
MNTEPTYIMSAEYLGEATVCDGILDIGGVPVRVTGFVNDSVPTGRSLGVYVRRLSSTLEVAEICLARHDGLAQECLDRQNEEADRYPGGAKEYWRGEMVGKYTIAGRLMTDVDFEADWIDGDE